MIQKFEQYINESNNEPIDLIEKYKYDEKYYIQDLQKRKLISDKKEIKNYKIGDIITFYGGYHNNILYKSKIIGFDKDDNILILWDCYWFPINPNDSYRKISIMN